MQMRFFLIDDKDNTMAADNQGPLLLMWINFNTSMGKWAYA